MTMLTETIHANEFRISEAPGDRSREAITVGFSAALTAGTVLGKVFGPATAAAKSGGNTGNGTFVIDATTPTLALAKPGVYTLRCITAVVNGGVFRLEDPDGFVLGDVTIPPGAGNSVTLTEQIKGVLTDGATDFAVGDGFDITVPITGAKYYKLDTTRSDGANYAAGILYRDVDASAADAPGAAYVRDCEINAKMVTWPAGISAGNQATATRQLATRRGTDGGISLR